MPDPLTKTFELLAESQSNGAVELLIAALDSKYSAIHDKAVIAALRRGTTRCQTEVIRRLPVLTAAGYRLLEEQGLRLSGTLRAMRAARRRRAAGPRPRGRLRRRVL